MANLEVVGNTLDEFYIDERDNALSVNYNVKISYQLALRPDHPNPFRPVITLHHDLSGDARINITMYDMMGRRIVKALISNQQTAGYRST